MKTRYVDFTGDNSSFQTAANLNPLNHTYSTAGEFFPTLTIQTTLGRFSSLSGWNADANRIRINVQAPPEQVGSAISITDPVDAKVVAGNLYILSRSTATIFEYNSSGTLLRSLSGIGTSPRGLDVDSAGNVYVALSGNNQVAKYNPNGSSFALDTIFNNGTGLIGKTDQTSGTGNGEFNSPYDVAVSSDGSVIYVSDTQNHRIQKFSSDGTFASSVGSQGNGFGQFNNPKGLSFDGGANLFVVDSGNNRVVQLFGGEVYKMFGTAGTSLGQYQSPLNVAFNSQKIYVADTGNNRIQKLDSGTFDPICQISSLGLSQPSGVCTVDNATEERIYIADTGNNRVLLVKLPPQSDPLNGWTSARQNLINGNPEAALTHFLSSKVDSFRALFAAIGNTRLNQSMTAIGTLTPLSVDEDEARYYFTRTIAGEQFMFIVTFEKQNGQWKIRAF